MQLPNSLLKPNQLCAFVVNVNDNPFDLKQNLGIQCDEAFTSCVMRGRMDHFEMHVLTGWELKHFPIMLITGDECDPTDESMYLE
jgi:hypothetical protein